MTMATIQSPREKSGRYGKIFSAVMLVAAVVYFVVPVYWLVVASTKDSSQLFSTPGFWFSDLRLLENLQKLNEYQDGIFWRWMLNSAIYSGLGALLMTALSLVTGYALVVYRFRGRAVLLGVVFLSMLIPQTVLAQPTYSLVVNLGLNNTYWGVLLPSLVYPFGILLGYVYAQTTITRDVVEAARLDGANEGRIFWSVGLRLLLPSGVTILLFAFIGTWNNYMLPLLVLNDTKLLPVTVGLANWNAAATIVPGLPTLIVVGALLSVIPVVVVFALLKPYWQNGFDLTGARFEN